MIQDNRRAIMVGMRTNGGGGSTSTWPTFYSEALPSNTNSLVIRNHEVVTPDYPTAPFVENIGVRPDIELNIMTRENLMNGGATFVQAFTAIMVDRIKAAAPK